jgi:hypothetical protein
VTTNLEVAGACFIEEVTATDDRFMNQELLLVLEDEREVGEVT